MSDDPTAIRVNIYGREYSIKGDGDANYIAEIAHYVDMKMREMTDNVAMASTSKVAILAALNITDELYQKEKQINELEENRSAVFLKLADRIEKELSEDISNTEETYITTNASLKFPEIKKTSISISSRKD